MSIIVRTHDAHLIAEAIAFFSKGKVDPIDWVSNPDNIALKNKHGDLALFAHMFYQKPIYGGHYFFKSRGKQAIKVAHEFLDEIFNTWYNIKVVMGLTPIENRAARWLSRRVGFTSYGIEEVAGKDYELFILTKKEFEYG